jgi:ABC-type phosphate/phosphonate transport system substrate-binding protein
VKEDLHNVLLNMDEDEQGKAALSHLLVDRFVLIGKEAYTGIRDMALSLRHRETDIVAPAEWEQMR